MDRHDHGKCSSLDRKSLFEFDISIRILADTLSCMACCLKYDMLLRSIFITTMSKSKSSAQGAISHFARLTQLTALNLSDSPLGKGFE